MDRRTSIKWVLTASASVPFLKGFAFGAEPASSSAARISSVTGSVAKGYGTDPKLLKVYKAGEIWPLTFTPEQRRIATALSDLIIPADATSPSASAVGTIDFIDEWISAPYKPQQRDRKIVIDGFKRLDLESAKRFSNPFAMLSDEQHRAICDDLCYAPKAKAQFAVLAKFFARYRDLTAGGYYTTPQGRQDLKYVGNTPLTRFDGPPLEVLQKVGLA